MHKVNYRSKCELQGNCQQIVDTSMHHACTFDATKMHVHKNIGL